MSSNASLAEVLNKVNQHKNPNMGMDDSDTILEYLNNAADVGTDIFKHSLSDDQADDFLKLLMSGVVMTMIQHEGFEYSAFSSMIMSQPKVSALMIAYLIQVVVGIMTEEEIR